MKTGIYWFSGTGNSYWLAHELCACLDDAVCIDIASDAWKAQPSPGQVVVVYPTFCGGIPLIVLRFLRDVGWSPETDVHLLTNYGRFPMGSLVLPRRELARRGIGVRGGFGFRMPSNYTPFGGAIPEERQKARFEVARARLPEVAAVIRDPARNAWAGCVLSAWFWTLLHPLCTYGIRQYDRAFRVDDRCNGCGLCARLCPVGDIRMEDGHPVWQGRCEQCFRCLQYCPQESLQYKRVSVGRKRYHHPEVPASAWKG